MQAGVESRDQTYVNSLLLPSSPSLLLWIGGKESNSKGKMEECLPGISRREQAETDFDAKSGRERGRKQDQADRKVAGVLGAFYKHHLSISALNLFISTRATD